MRRLSDGVLQHLRRVAQQPELDPAKYRCLETAGSGGMGTVYLVKDVQLQRKVALKVIDLPDEQGKLAGRMWREARIIAALEHPGIVPIHDVGTLSDGRVYYAMKYVNGKRLDEYVKTSPTLPERLRIFLKVCEAVAFAHSHRIIHRDLKPENIMIADFGEVLVMDWGLAKQLNSDETRISSARPSRAASRDLQEGAAQSESSETLAGTILGTPAYMAPEQASGDISKVDERSDVYALGAILYFLLHSTPPPDSDRRPAGSRKRETEAPKSIAKPPKPVAAICAKAMAQSPQDRYASALHLAADIENHLNGLGVSCYQENIFEKTARWLKRNKFIVGLVLMYLLMRFFILFLTRR